MVQIVPLWWVFRCMRLHTSCVLSCLLVSSMRAAQGVSDLVGSWAMRKARFLPVAHKGPHAWLPKLGLSWPVHCSHELFCQERPRPPQVCNLFSYRHLALLRLRVSWILCQFIQKKPLFFTLRERMTLPPILCISGQKILWFIHPKFKSKLTACSNIISY